MESSMVGKGEGFRGLLQRLEQSSQYSVLGCVDGQDQGEGEEWGECRLLQGQGLGQQGCRGQSQTPTTLDQWGTVLGEALAYDPEVARLASVSKYGLSTSLRRGNNGDCVHNPRLLDFGRVLLRVPSKEVEEDGDTCEEEEEEAEEEEDQDEEIGEYIPEGYDFCGERWAVVNKKNKSSGCGGGLRHSTKGSLSSNGQSGTEGQGHGHGLGDEEGQEQRILKGKGGGAKEGGQGNGGLDLGNSQEYR
ncbi:unnamed protein product, partial [Choristocarpus tenellus]